MKVDLYEHVIDLGPNPSKICQQRWSGTLSPEPETVAWIESLPAGASFLDIGASVGIHAIRAAVRGLRVIAIEPHQESFDELQRIVAENRLPIYCYNIALTNTCCVGAIGKGRSKYTFLPGDTEGQPVVGVTLQKFYATLKDVHTLPEYIKMDVDGNEEEILAGGREIISQAKSLLIEVDPWINAGIPQTMHELGFVFDRQQVNACMVTEGKYLGMANYIFTRA